jgi:hypothetical protein
VASNQSDHLSVLPKSCELRAVDGVSDCPISAGQSRVRGRGNAAVDAVRALFVGLASLVCRIYSATRVCVAVKTAGLEDASDRLIVDQIH